MKLFIDSANIDEIRAAHEMGVIAGVTTNPTLVAKEGRPFQDVLRDIIDIVDGPISAEVISTDAEGMIREGEQLAALSKNIVIKIPMTVEGLKAVKALTKKKIRTNVTLIFSANQALLRAGGGDVCLPVHRAPRRRQPQRPGADRHDRRDLRPPRHRYGDHRRQRAPSPARDGSGPPGRPYRHGAV